MAVEHGGRSACDGLAHAASWVGRRRGGRLYAAVVDDFGHELVAAAGKRGHGFVCRAEFACTAAHGCGVLGLRWSEAWGRDGWRGMVM